MDEENKKNNVQNKLMQIKTYNFETTSILNSKKNNLWMVSNTVLGEPDEKNLGDSDLENRKSPENASRSPSSSSSLSLSSSPSSPSSSLSSSSISLSPPLSSKCNFQVASKAGCSSVGEPRVARF